MSKYRKPILEVLKASDKYLGPSEIGRKITDKFHFENAPRTSILSQLKKLEKDGLVVKERKKWGLFDFKKIMDKIKDMLINNPEGLTVKDFEKKGIEKTTQLYSALRFLQSDGLLTGRPIFQMGKHERDIWKFKLTPVAYSELNHCPICNEEFNSNETILAVTIQAGASFVTSSQNRKSVSIHVGCIKDSNIINKDFFKEVEYGEGVLCDYCGLPISPKEIDVPGVDHGSIKDYFYSKGLKKYIDFLNNLESDCLRLDSPFASDDPLGWHLVFDLSILNSKGFSYYYEKHGLEMPQEIADLLKDKNNSVLDAIVINCTGKKDLSHFSNAEIFIKNLVKLCSNDPEEIKIDELVIETWKESRRIKKRYEDDILRIYEKLLGPGGIIYLNSTWPPGLEGFIRKSNKKFNPPDCGLFSTVLAAKIEGRTYHPYCAEKIEGGYQGHPDDKNEKEVKKP